MSGAEATGLVMSIDEGIAYSDERIQKEVASFVEENPEEVGRQIAEDGVALIPTFAGYYELTEEQLREIAGDSVQIEELSY